MRIYVKVGNYEATALEKVRNEEIGKKIIKSYEAKDRYEIETEGYKMPRAWEGKYPTYFLAK